MTRGRRWGEPADGEIYIEFHVVGNFARAVAVDATTGIEASVVGPARANPRDLERLAVRKLSQVLQNRAKGV
jgi:hypothetical protein